MGNVQRHINQWMHNREFLPGIPEEFHDWQITVAFYTALHAVDALLASDGVQGIHSHDRRNETLKKTNRYKAIRSPYLSLYGLSRTVRYLAAPEKWVPPTDVQQQVIVRSLYPIEKSVQKLLRQDLGLPKIELPQS